MPLFEFNCRKCGAHHEELMKFDHLDEWLNAHQCSCGGVLEKKMSLFAKTTDRWGDNTGTYGVNGFHCHQSGKRFYSKREQEKYMKSIGRVPVSEKELNNLTNRDYNERAQRDDYSDQIATIMKKNNGDFGEATAEVFNTKELKKMGLLDKGVSDG